MVISMFILVCVADRCRLAPDFGCSANRVPVPRLSRIRLLDAEASVAEGAGGFAGQCLEFTLSESIHGDERACVEITVRF